MLKSWVIKITMKLIAPPITIRGRYLDIIYYQITIIKKFVTPLHNGLTSMNFNLFVETKFSKY